MTVAIAARPILKTLVGGRGRGPARVTVAREDWDEAQMEAAALRTEARQMCAAALPLARQLYPAMHELGPRHEQIVAALIHRLERYERRNTEVGPRAA